MKTETYTIRAMSMQDLCEEFGLDTSKVFQQVNKDFSWGDHAFAGVSVYEFCSCLVRAEIPVPEEIGNLDEEIMIDLDIID